MWALIGVSVEVWRKKPGNGYIVLCDTGKRLVRLKQLGKKEPLGKEVFDQDC